MSDSCLSSRCLLWLHSLASISFLFSCAIQPTLSEQNLSWREYATPEAMGALAHAHCLVKDNAVLVVGGIREGSLTVANSRGFRFDLETKSWRSLNYKQRPAPKQNFSIAELDNGFLYFGGDEGKVEGRSSNQTYIYDLRLDQWREILPQGDAIDGRSRASLLQSDGKVFLYGGRGQRDELNSALFEPKSESWTILSTPKELTTRLGASVVTAEKNVFIWGGFAGKARKADGFLLDQTSGIWTYIPADAALTARANAKSLVIGSKIYIYGGATNRGPAADGAIFDTTLKTWEKIPPLKGNEDLKGFELALLPDKGFVLWGGRHGNQEFNAKAFLFDTKDMSWSEIQTSTSLLPPGRIAHCLGTGPKGEIFVLGGIGEVKGNGLKQFEGLWLLSEEDSNRK